MRNVIFDRRRAERFAQLLDEADGGPRHHGRSRADDQLAEFVALGHELTSESPGPEIDSDFRTGLRAMLMATAEREGIGVTSTDPESAAGPVAHLLRAGAAADAAGRRLRARGAIVVGVIAGAVVVSGMSAASSDANPGDALYSVKRHSEQAQLALAGSDEDKGRLHLEFAATRLREARAVTGDTAGFEAVLNDMDADTRAGVKLLAGAATREHSDTPLDPVDPFVTGQRRQIGGFLDTLSGANRDRALGSLILLDSVDKRSRALTDGFACPAAEVLPPTDALGPLPNLCDTGDDDPVGSPVHGGGQRSQDQVPAARETDGAPATGAPAGTGTPTPATATPAPAPARDEPAPGTGTGTGTSDEPVLEEPEPSAPAPSPTPAGKNVLGDLLGGLLGG
ncbi:hypothetical protein J2S43_006502 [Catenuloplanes nepalensis]|uniref:DUF5667 domain-containing protein n=1 Tax=Catenuloplanes nepalensis TaxID=587533 RepID=A0ABT9N2R5_9ACTN|nr:DUF5667 domain-containing protein [Catenuloplanes nepalensis]MDP9797990.1 hypothetical protein [Catenuloplanes nepalensis]